MVAKIPDQVFEDLEVTAYHEAGHAVLRAAAGWDVEKITIYTRDPIIGFPGATSLKGSSNIVDLASDPDAHLACPLGGYGATLVLFHQDKLPKYSSECEVFSWFSQGTGGDEDQYFSVLRALGKRPKSDDDYGKLREFHDAARRIAVPKLNGLWDHVEAVAAVVYQAVKPQLKVGEVFQGAEIPETFFSAHLPYRRSE